jgi:hypothetical protein
MLFEFKSKYCSSLLDFKVRRADVSALSTVAHNKFAS